MLMRKWKKKKRRRILCSTNCRAFKVAVVCGENGATDTIYDLQNHLQLLCMILPSLDMTVSCIIHRLNTLRSTFDWLNWMLGFLCLSEVPHRWRSRNVLMMNIAVNVLYFSFLSLSPRLSVCVSIHLAVFQFEKAGMSWLRFDVCDLMKCEGQKSHRHANKAPVPKPHTHTHTKLFQWIKGKCAIHVFERSVFSILSKHSFVFKPSSVTRIHHHA